MEKKKTKCKKCGYLWTYKGEMYFTRCPRCYSHVKIKEVEKNDKK